jgi:hypothetical protein
MNIKINIIKEEKETIIKELDYKPSREKEQKKNNILNMFRTIFEGADDYFASDEWILDIYDDFDSSYDPTSGAFTVTLIPFDLNDKERSSLRRKWWYSKLLKTLRSYFSEKERLSHSSAKKRSLWNSFDSFVLEDSAEMMAMFRNGEGFPEDGKIQLKFKWSDKVEKDFGFSQTVSDYDNSMRMRNAQFQPQDLAPAAPVPKSK